MSQYIRVYRFLFGPGYTLRSVGDLIGSAVGAVTSAFGRTGDVVAVAGDYEASQVDNDSSVPGATVADALDALLSSGSEVLDITRDAAATIHSLRAVKLASDGIREVDITDAADLGAAIGLSLVAGSTSDPIDVRQKGLVEDSGLSLTAGLNVWIGSGGALTQTPPTGVAWSQVIGWAVDTHKIYITLSVPLALG